MSNLKNKIVTVTGTTSSTDADITAALKAGSDASTHTVFVIKKLSLSTETSVATVKLNGATNAASLAEDSLGSGRWVFSTNEGDMNITQVVIAETGIAWSATFLY